jgi:altronate dehydratase small subunit
MNKVLKINEIDNVVTTTEALKKDAIIEVEGNKITVNADIPRFHKIAIVDIPKGELVYKYGQIIGDALEDIKAGDHVHVNNIESTRGRGDKEVEQ